jgi:hypothetical protein
MHGEMKYGYMHGGMKGHHMHDEMRKDWIKKSVMMKEIMEHLSPEDKKKLTTMKLDMKISMAEKKLEMMEDRKKILAKKLDMKTDMAKQEIEMLKALRDMLKSEK